MDIGYEIRKKIIRGNNEVFREKKAKNIGNIKEEKIMDDGNV